MKNIFLTIPSKRLFVILFLLCLNSSFAQTVFYANSATGNDANAGTIGAPFKTFHKAYTSATSGDIINLTGTFTWTATDEIGDLSTTGYSISKNISIEGNNASTTIIQAANADNISDRRVFTFIFGYTVNINNCTIRYGKSSDGGGIQVDGSSTINNCDVSYNRASGSGGGVNCRGNVHITNSLISNNFAFYMGGGVNRDYYSGNDGTPGSSNTLIITNSTIAYNQVLATYAYIEGGGVFFRRGIGTITNSIIAYNKVTNADSSTNGLGTGDPSAVVNLKNNIIANNFRYNCWSGDIGHRESSNSGTYVDNGYNIFGVKGYYSQGLTVSSTSWLDHISNCSTPDGVFILQNGQNCRSGQLYLATVLAENSTLNNIKNFEILDQTSIAINNGSNTSNLSTSIPNLDMRGFSRVGNVDIGSIEYQSVVASFEAPVAGNISSSQLVCYNSSASDITLSGYTGSIQWQTSLNNSTWTNISGATNSILTSTQIGTLTQTKYFRANVSNGGCTVTSNPTVSVTVNSLPSRPVTVTTINYCQGDTATALTATATTGHTLQWYSVATGGTASLTAPTPITSSVGTTTYYVSQLNNSTNCESERGAITVTVYSLPLAPTAPTTINYCQGATATALTATATTGHALQWYTVSTGGTASNTAPTPLTNTIGTTTYYVSQKNNTTNCEGPRTAITVNVNSVPTISGVQNMAVGGSTLQLTGSGTPASVTPWVSSNTAAATISATGVVAAVNTGTTTITYTTAEGCSVSAIINILNCASPFGNAMSFDGTNDYVTVGDSFENLADVTTEAWVYWRGSTNAFSEIFTKDLVSAFAITSTNKLHANFGNGSGWDIGLNSTASIPLNTWTHLAVTRQNGLVRMYINGQQDSATATMSATGQNSSHRALGAKLLGTSLYPNSTINGSIDEVRFWSTARTQAQIQASMNTELVGNESGLLAYYTFNHGIAEGNNASVNTIVNIVNSASNGTITNSEKNGTISNLVVGVTADFTISGAAIVCSNTTSQYTHPIAGGTWSLSSGATATINSSGLLTSAGDENITISYSYTLNGCPFTATRAITIQTPAAPTAPTTINYCQGVIATALTATAATGHSLQWYTVSTGGTASSTAPTPLTTTLGATIYYVSQKNNTTNCEGPRTAITVNVNAIPTISGVQNMIVGGSTLQLTGSGTPDATTPWASSNTGVATVSSTGIVTAVAAGTTTITYTTVSGCSITASIVVINCATPLGNALSFDGVNDFVVVDNVGSNSNFIFSGTSTFTIEAWINRRGVTPGEGMIFSKHNGGVGNNYLLSINSSGFPVVYRESNAAFSNNVLTGTSVIPLNEWHHIATVYDGTNLQLYVDGILNRTTSTGSITRDVSSLRVAIGGSYTNGNPSNFFNGSIDEVRVWNVARTAIQIRQSLNNTLQGNEAGLVAYYDFNQGLPGGDNTAISSVVNTVNSASNGILTNFAKNGTTSNFVEGANGVLDIVGPASICANRTSQFTHPISGGTWSVSNGAAATVSTSGLLTAIGSENISVSYTYTINDCSFTATKAVEIVSPAITAQPSTAAQNLCLNENATALTITATNLATTYQWYRNATASNTGGTLISGATSSSYTPPTNVAGTTYYYCIVSGTCSPAITSDVSGAVTVSPISVAGTISGATSVCSGVTTTLTLSGSVGAIQWQQLIGPTWTDIAGATNTTFTSPTLTQNTSYRAVITSGFCSSVNTANYNVVVNVLPIISGASSVGVGESVALTATTTAASSNAWVSSNSVIATITNAGVVNGLTIGTTTITYTNSNSCSATQSIAVTAGTTQTPVLTSPATNSTGATILNISYTLPETPLAGSVRLTFTPTAGGTPIVWTMTNTTSVTFSHSVGTDPLVTNPNNVLSGTLLSFATYDLTLSYQDAYGNPVAQVTNTNIQTLAPPSISFSSASYQGTINTSLTTITVLNGGGTSTYSISPTLPNGVSINTTTGVVSGIPTVAMATQLYTVTATNAAGTSTATFNLFIDSDLDGDGIGDTTDPDIDGDGVPNIEEIQEGTSPTDPTDYKDTDGDGVPDYVEVQQGTNPNVPGDARDTDGDGVPDYIEILQGTNPNTPGDSLIDTDGDGVPDYVEVQQGSDPNNPNDSIDTDGDSIPDYVENLQGTNPNIPGDAIDTDGDGVPDYIEVQQGTNPNVPGDARDTDGDGVPDYIEIQQGTNPNTPGDALDTDGDGVPDYIELREGTDPNDPSDLKDDDGDGISNFEEGYNYQNPNDSRDTDGDGIPDYRDLDSDGDTIPDRYDAFPLDKTEWKDTDGDGIGDNADTDDDNDGILDVCDVDVNGDGIPDNGVDMDGDGIIDSCDPDRDGDGVNNTSDNCPDTPNRDQADRDRDGKGDVCDTIELNVMEGLTPNGDGINDTWVIYNIENHPGSIVRVFNTNGKQVFYSANYKNDWNGNYQGSSEMLPVGSYLFQIDLDGDGTIDSQGWMYISK